MQEVYVVLKTYFAWFGGEWESAYVFATEEAAIKFIQEDFYKKYNCSLDMLTKDHVLEELKKECNLPGKDRIISEAKSIDGMCCTDACNNSTIYKLFETTLY